MRFKVGHFIFFRRKCFGFEKNSNQIKLPMLAYQVTDDFLVMAANVSFDGLYLSYERLNH